VEAIHAKDVAVRHAKNAALNVWDHIIADFGGLIHQYSIGDSLKGYTGKFSQETLQAIRSRPEVAYVEKDSMVYASDLEKGAPWGLSRISHRKSLSFGTFNKYEYEHDAGHGVTAYVIDT